MTAGTDIGLDIRVLLATDDSQAARSVQRTLAGARGLRFACALSTDALVDGAADALEVDVVVLDLAPTRDVAALLPLVEQACGALPPVVVLSGAAHRTAELDALAGGADEFVRKGRDVLTQLPNAVRRAHLRGREIASQQRHALMCLNQAAVVTHEVRSPLGAIVAGLEMLRDGERADPELLEILTRTARSLSETVDHLLDASERAPSTSVSLRGLAAEVLGMAALRCPEGVELVVDIASSLPDEVWVQHVPIRQVLINLIHNAMKFTARGTVTLRMGLTLEGWELAVEDTGQGIAPDKLESVFGAYVVAGVPAHPGERSTGLGLAIVDNLVRDLGGTITVESALGAGTIMRVGLPGPVLPPRPVFEPHRRRRVLVVDDCGLSAEVIRRGLDARGCAVTVARNATQALQLWSDAFDAVVVDVELPEMSGVELVRRLGGMQADVFFVSGHDPETLGRHSAQIPGAAAFTKPVDLSRLAVSILTR